MRWGISILGATSAALAAASCTYFQKKGTEPSGDLPSSPTPERYSPDRYLSPLIPLAKSMMPTKYPSSGMQEFLIGASFVCDGPKGNQQAKGRCEQNARKIMQKVEQFAGRSVPCPTDKKEGDLTGAIAPTTRYEWSCKIGRKPPFIYNMDSIWEEARNRFLGPGAPKDRKYEGSLDQSETTLSKPIPNDPVGQALYLFGRRDRSLKDPKRPGSTYHLYGQDLRDSDLEDRDEESVEPFGFFEDEKIDLFK